MHTSLCYPCSFDFARGYSGDHVADYCEATAPEFAVTEFWDSLAYRRGVALRNQVRLSLGTAGS